MVGEKNSTRKIREKIGGSFTTIAELASQVKLSLQNTIDEKELDLQETLTALRECEHQCRQQELKLNEMNVKLQNDTLEFEKKLAASESTVFFLKDCESELQNKLADLATTKAENFQTRINELERLNKIN